MIIRTHFIGVAARAGSVGVSTTSASGRRTWSFSAAIAGAPTRSCSAICSSSRSHDRRGARALPRERAAIRRRQGDAGPCVRLSRIGIGRPGVRAWCSRPHAGARSRGGCLADLSVARASRIVRGVASESAVAGRGVARTCRCAGRVAAGRDEGVERSRDAASPARRGLRHHSHDVATLLPAVDELVRAAGAIARADSARRGVHGAGSQALRRQAAGDWGLVNVSQPFLAL